MCYAVPARIISVKGMNAVADYGGVRKQINISLMGRLQKGDYVMVHAGFAIQALSADRAVEALRLLKDYESGTGGGLK